MITIDQKIAELIENSFSNVTDWPIGNLILCIIALLLSVVLCGIIGIEREKRGRSAGLRTHLLVGVGSCIIMIISIYGFPLIFSSDKRDVARLAAQVITGVGFLGAGAIIHRSSGTRGLTTAATIWIVMAIGLACGSMNFILAIGGTLLIVIVLTVFRRFETRLNKKAPLIVLKAKPNSPVISKILELSQTFDCSIDDLRVELLENDEVEITFLAIAKSKEIRINDFISAIEMIEGITKVELMNGHRH